MVEPLIGQIILFAGKFPPQGWMFCNGQSLPIVGNEALYSIIGTTYGYSNINGEMVAFCLPDLRSSIPFGPSHGIPFGPSYVYDLGEKNNGPGKHGSYRYGTIGMNYIIAVQGVYPPRD